MKSKQQAIADAKELQKLFLSGEYWVFCQPKDSPEFDKVVNRILQDMSEDALCLFNDWVGDLVFIKKSLVSFATLHAAMSIAPAQLLTYRDGISPNTQNGEFLIGALRDAAAIEDIEDEMNRCYKILNAGAN